MKISFKTAIINGSSPGLGRAIGQAPEEVQNAIKDWCMRVGPLCADELRSEVANVCALLCSDQALFLTGQTIVDGGNSLNPDFPKLRNCQNRGRRL